MSGSRRRGIKEKSNHHGGDRTPIAGNWGLRQGRNLDIDIANDSSKESDSFLDTDGTDSCNHVESRGRLRLSTW